MPRKGKGYRRRFTRPPKGTRRWNSRTETERNKERDFVGFDVDPRDSINIIRHNSEVHLNDGRFPRNPIRVLSLFDGIGTGLVVLEKLGFHIEVYFSCEVDENALRVQRFNFHEKIVPLGCVCDLREEQLHALGRIDLLIGGSPCQDFSLANPKRRGIYGEGSTGKFFLEYHRILNVLLQNARKTGVHLFWLFENTAAMETAVKTEISRLLGCQPLKICASSFVPMRRERNFWGNIPLMEKLPCLPKCSKTLQTFLRPYRTAVVTAIPTITTQPHSQLSGHAKKYPVLEEGKERLLFVTELELLFGFREHFTDAGDLSVSDRRKLLGNAWSVNVVEQILKPLTIMFSLK